jgi:hypothetical protein
MIDRTVPQNFCKSIFISFLVSFEKNWLECLFWIFLVGFWAEGPERGCSLFAFFSFLLFFRSFVRPSLEILRKKNFHCKKMNKNGHRLDRCHINSPTVSHNRGHLISSTVSHNRGHLILSTVSHNRGHYNSSTVILYRGNFNSSAVCFNRGH